MTICCEEIRELTSAAYEKAVVEHGDLGLSADDYANRLGDAMAKLVGCCCSPAECVRGFRVLHTSDLYLSAACAHGYDDAWTRLRLLYKNYITELFRWMHRSDTAQEAGESLISDLFLPDRSGQSRIGSYDGRSSLPTWLRVVVSHRVINQRHRTARDRQCVGELPDLPDKSSVNSLETRLRAGRYASLLQRCLPEACQCLTQNETLILLWRFDHDLQLGHIARMMSIHQSTVTRQMEKGLRRLKSELEFLLASRHNLDSEAIRECLRLLVEADEDSLSILTLIRNAAHERQTQPVSQNAAENIRRALTAP